MTDQQQATDMGDDELTVGELRRLIRNLPDDMPVVSWDTALTGRIGPVLSVGVAEDWRRRESESPALFIGQDRCTSNLEEIEFVTPLWPKEQEGEGEE